MSNENSCFLQLNKGDILVNREDHDGKRETVDYSKFTSSNYGPHNGEFCVKDVTSGDGLNRAVSAKLMPHADHVIHARRARCGFYDLSWFSF